MGVHHAAGERSRGGRGRTLVARFAFVVVAVAGVGFAALTGGRRLLAVSRVDWAVRQGIAALEEAATPDDVAAALTRWEQDTGGAWRHNPELLIDRLYARRPAEDSHVRTLLTHVSGVDYGERVQDWDRWHRTRERLRRGEPPEVSNRERVHLQYRWRAPVGLTAWFTTILPIGGRVYVASLGTALDDPTDEADGLVRVDGETGSSELIFEPPDRGPRDVVGVAGGEDSLFVACRNGHVYSVTPDGEMRWSAAVGGAAVTAPLALDANADGSVDVIVGTARGTIVALSGRSGKSLWVARLRRADDKSTPATYSVAQIALAVGDVLAARGPELLVTTIDGSVRVLSPRDGATLGMSTLHAGSLAGAVATGPVANGEVPAWVGDRGGRIWSLVRGRRELEAVPAWSAGVGAGIGIVASLRTLAATPECPLRVVACTAGSLPDKAGSVCVLAPGGPQWRLAPGGVIWGTPALADLNGDGEPELVVVSLDGSEAGGGDGLVTILSSAGHCLTRLRFSAPIECSPVIADVDADGQLEILVADRIGMLHCIGTRGYGPVEWGVYGGDKHNTRNAAAAYAWGQVPPGLQWRWKPALE